MQTFQIEKENIGDHTISVSGEVCHHLTKVLRVRKGEFLRFSDGKNYYCGSVAALEISRKKREITAARDTPVLPPANNIIA